MTVREIRLSTKGEFPWSEIAVGDQILFVGEPNTSRVSNAANQMRRRSGMKFTIAAAERGALLRRIA